MIQPDILDHHGGPRPRGHDAPQAGTGRFGWILEGLPPLVLADPQLEALAATMQGPSAGAGSWTGETTRADHPAVPPLGAPGVDTAGSAVR